MRIPVAPSAPGRTPRGDELRQSYEEQLRSKERAIRQRQELWDRLARLIHAANDAWLTSAPHEQPLRLEVKPNSDLPDRLYDLGLDLVETGTAERIEGGKFVPVICYRFQIPLPR
jgi:hypothetical protein